MRIVKASLEQKHVLDKWDPDGDTIVWIKQVKQGEEIRRTELLLQRKIERPDSGNPVEHMSLPIGELMMLECYLSFVDSTIEWEVPIDVGDPEKGMRKEPMFPKGLSESEFRKRFASLDPELAEEWQEKARLQNPQWNPREVVQKN